jgi:pimeloyl-ACP methyl ester carboxylesterase
MNRIRLLLAAAIVLAAPTRPLAAQRDLGLLHGFMSGPETWNTTIPILRNTLDLGDIFAPHYVSLLPIGLNAARMNLPRPWNTILVGHSEGGLVARARASTLPGGIVGLVTLGTPNLGANMADNHTQFLAHLGATLWGAFDVSGEIWALDPPWYMTLLDDVYYYLDLILGALSWLPSAIEHVVPLIPVFSDVSPTSGFITNLNDPFNTSESINAPTRVSLAYEAPRYWDSPAWRLATREVDGYSIGAGVRIMSSYSYMVSFEAADEWMNMDYEGDLDGNRYWALRDLSFDAYFYANNLEYLDEEWCADVTMRISDYWSGAPLRCESNDLFINTADQFAPNATPLVGAASIHTQETDQAADISYALTRLFGVRTR